MPAGIDAPIDPRFANLDANATIELCNSLADYGEAGGLSRDLMMQVGRYAEARYAEDLEVLLAVGRMYLLGGEVERAKVALIRAGQLGQDEARVLPLLSQVLAQLDDPRTAEEALRDAPARPPVVARKAAPEAVRPSIDGDAGEDPSRKPRAVDSMSAAARARATAPGPATRAAAEDPSAAARAALPPSAFKRTEPVLPAVGRRTWADRGSAGSTTSGGPGGKERRTYTPTTPMTRMPGYGPSQPTTPIARQGQRVTLPGNVSRAAAAAEDPDEDAPAPSAQVAQVRTEVSRRAVARDALSSSSGSSDETPPPSSSRSPQPPSIGKISRIRILDPDDERRKLDPYELIGEIASGGMATVFLGRLAGAGGFSRFVAIKQLHPHLAREEQFVQMFLDEARLAAGIHNPHVVPILEVGQSKAGYFLVMEFIEGDTLAGLTARLAQKGSILPAKVAIRIVIDALTGLHAAHQLTDAEGVHLGLVHRDCTPQNILVGVDGSARITDFGVARAASRLAITRPQQVKGKVAYLSPEQAHAMDLDRRSDIFTMGIVLWETLAGRPLFQAETEATTLSRVVSGPIPSVRSYVPDMPPALDDVCRRALHRDRNRRFRTAAEMAEALERAASADDFGGAAPPRDLGRFVEATMGPELIAQRDAVRAGLGPSSLPSGRGVSSRHGSQPPPSLRGGASVTSSRGDAGSEAAARSQEGPVTPAPATAPSATAATSEAAKAPVEPAVRVSVEPPIEKTLPAAKSPDELAAAKAIPDAVPAAAPAAAKGASPLQGLLDRLPVARMGKGRLAALAVLVLVILTSPIWLKVSNKLLHRRRAVPGAAAGAATSSAGATAPAPAPAPLPRPQRAWDEADWAPDAGDAKGEPAAAQSAVPAAKAVPRPEGPDGAPAPKPTAAPEAQPVPKPTAIPEAQPAPKPTAAAHAEPTAPKPVTPKPPKPAPASDNPYGD